VARRSTGYHRAHEPAARTRRRARLADDRLNSPADGVHGEGPRSLRRVREAKIYWLGCLDATMKVVSALSRAFRDIRASTPFPRIRGTTATVLTRQLTDARRDLGRGSNLAGVAIDVRPGSCRSHNPRWSSRRDRWLPALPGAAQARDRRDLMRLVRTTRNSAPGATPADNFCLRTDHAGDDINGGDQRFCSRRRGRGEVASALAGRPLEGEARPRGSVAGAYLVLRGCVESGSARRHAPRSAAWLTLMIIDQSDSNPLPGSLERHRAPVIASSMGP